MQISTCCRRTFVEEISPQKIVRTTFVEEPSLKNFRPKGIVSAFLTSLSYQDGKVCNGVSRGNLQICDSVVQASCAKYWALEQAPDIAYMDPHQHQSHFQFQHVDEISCKPPILNRLFIDSKAHGKPNEKNAH
jgi:hypothetical protein